VRKRVTMVAADSDFTTLDSTIGDPTIGALLEDVVIMAHLVPYKEDRVVTSTMDQGRQSFKAHTTPELLRQYMTTKIIWCIIQ